MNKQIYLFSGILAIIASIACVYFDWRISAGIIIGIICSYGYFYLLNKSLNVKEDGSISKGGVIGFLVRILLIALPLAISVLLPEYFNIFGAFAGVMIFRIIMIIYFFKQKGEI